MSEPVVIDGFRMRGLEMSRIEVFTDAAFAFAVTLLVVSIDQIPRTYDELITVVQGVPAFAFSFGILFLFWLAHHRWSQRYGLQDITTLWLSAILVFIVMVYVYPLKMVSYAAVSQLFGADAGGMQINSASEIYTLFVIYGAGFVSMSLVMMCCYLHAYRKRQFLALNEIELFVTRWEAIMAGVMALTGVASITLALMLPDDATNAFLIGLPGWAYMSLAIVMPALG
ncbi:MAG: TMEM175 family protein, partial [Pseudomonadota bacterium]